MASGVAFWGKQYGFKNFNLTKLLNYNNLSMRQSLKFVDFERENFHKDIFLLGMMKFSSCKIGNK